MKKVIGQIIVITLLVVLLAGGTLAVRAYRAPLAPAMKLDLAQAEPTAAPAADAEKVCGMSGRLTILVIGRDDYVWEVPAGADAIRVVKADFDNRSLSVLSLPRDLWLKTDALAEPYDIAEARLGPAYTAVLKQAGDTPEGNITATNAIGQVLVDNFGLTFNHYTTVKERSLSQLVNTLGGIEVDVAQTMTVSGVEIKAGKQTMDGKTAELYARYFGKGESEDARFDRQNRVMNGLLAKLADPAVFAKVPDLYTQFKDLLITDLSPEQITALTCLTREVGMGNIQLGSIPADQLSTGADGAVQLKDLAVTKKSVLEFLGK